MIYPRRRSGQRFLHPCQARAWSRIPSQPMTTKILRKLYSSGRYIFPIVNPMTHYECHKSDNHFILVMLMFWVVRCQLGQDDWRNTSLDYIYSVCLFTCYSFLLFPWVSRFLFPDCLIVSLSSIPYPFPTSVTFLSHVLLLLPIFYLVFFSYSFIQYNMICSIRVFMCRWGESVGERSY